MAKTVAWGLIALGVVHLVFGMLRFRLPLLEALNAGFIGQFAQPELRRTAFWFLAAGPFLILIGHLCVRALEAGDLHLLTLVARYLLVIGLIGIAAFPASPLWAVLLFSLLLFAVGAGKLR